MTPDARETAERSDGPAIHRAGTREGRPTRCGVEQARLRAAISDAAYRPTHPRTAENPAYRPRPHAGSPWTHS